MGKDQKPPAIRLARAETLSRLALAQRARGGKVINGEPSFLAIRDDLPLANGIGGESELVPERCPIFRAGFSGRPNDRHGDRPAA